MQVGIENDFGIAMCSKMESRLLQLAAKFLVIEYLPVEGEHNVAIRTPQRLISGIEIHDSQSSRPKRYVGGHKVPLMVRATMSDRFERR